MISAKNIMTKEVVTIPQNFNIIDAARTMTSKSLSSLVVVENQKPIAIISETDVVRALVTRKTRVKDVMSKEFFVVEPFTKFSDITNHLREKNIKRFLVVENEKLVGLITESDIIEATRDFTRFHQITQEIILGIFGLATAFFLFYFSPVRATLFG